MMSEEQTGEVYAGLGNDLFIVAAKMMKDSGESLGVGMNTGIILAGLFFAWHERMIFHKSGHETEVDRARLLSDINDSIDYYKTHSHIIHGLLAHMGELEKKMDEIEGGLTDETAHEEG